MIGVYNYTVVATYLASIIGVCGIFASAQGNILQALLCLVISGFLDSIDGKIARTKKDRTDVEKAFGIQIDSLNDIICFGMLPASLAFSMISEWKGGKVPVWAWLVLAFFTLAGLIRLAYFNVTCEEQTPEPGKRRYYVGLPITTSALVLPFLFVLATLIPSAATLIFVAGLLITAVLYICPFHITKPGLPAILCFCALGVAEMAVVIVKCF